MNSQATHLIGKETLDLEIADVQKAQEIQRRVANIMHDRVNPRIEKLLTRFSPEVSDLVRFNSLSIDIGAIPYEQLDQQLEDKIIEALEDLLFRHFSHDPVKTEKQAERISLEQRLLPLMEFFLLHGYLPWWAQQEEINLQQVLAQLLQKEGSHLARMLKRIGKNDKVPRRLVATFNEQEIYAIIRVLEPAEASFIIRYSEELQKKHEEQPIVNAGAEAFKKAQLYVILSYLLNDRGTAFNRKEFVAYTLQQLARHYSISYRHLLDFLAQNLQSTWQLQQSHSELKDIIEALHEEETKQENIFSFAHLSDNITPEQAYALYNYFFNGHPLPASFRLSAGVHTQELFMAAFGHARTSADDIPRTVFMKMLRETARELDSGKKIITNVQDQEPGEKEQAPVPDALNVFTYFLEEESLSPGYRELSASHLLKILQQLIQHESRALQSLLKNLAEPLKKAVFLVRQLPDPFLIQLVHVIEPAQAHSILLFRNKSLAQQKKNKEITESTRSFNQVLWEFIYQYLLGKKNSRFHNKSFVKQVLGKLAAHYNLSYSVLISNLRQHIQAGNNLQQDEQELLGILYELGQESPGNHDVFHSHEPAKGEAEEKQQVQALLNYLLHGSLPWWAGNMGLSPAGILSALLSTKISLDRELLFPALRSTSQQAVQSRLENLFHSLPDKQSQLFARLSGTDANTLQQLVHSVTAFRQHFRLYVSGLPAEAWLFRYWLQQTATSARQSASNTAALPMTGISSAAGTNGSIFTDAKSMAPLLLALLKKGMQELRPGQLTETSIPAASATLEQNLRKKLSAWLQQFNAGHLEQELFHILSKELEPLLQRSAAELLENKKQVQLQLYGLLQKHPELAAIQTQLLQLFEALQTGEASSSQRKELIHLLARQELSNSLRYELLSLLFSRRGMRPQIPQSYPPTFIKELVSLASASEPAMLDMLSHTATLLQENEPANDTALFNFWSSAIQELLKKKNFNQQYLLQKSIQSFARATSYQYEEVLRMLMQKLSLTPASFHQARLLSQLFALLPGSGKKKQQSQQQPGPKNSDNQSAQENHSQPNTKKKTAPGPEATAGKKHDLKKSAKQDPDKKTEKENKDPEPTTREDIYIHNAGLVILHPFLARLFDKTGLTENFAFKTPEQAERAVHILEYCASGRDNAPEFQLVLNKILCGLAPETVLEHKITLSETEKETCDDLLTAIISQWPVLKGTSIDGLRGSFLLRKARLEHTENSWNMQVEKKGFDVLMDKLPWSFGTIRLRWMEKALVTQWR